MKSKPVFALSWVAVIAVVAWLGSRSLPVHGDTPTAKNPGEQAADELKVANEKLDRILKILQSQAASGKQPHVMVEISLPDEIQKIFNAHVHRGQDGKVVAGELHRGDFSKKELSQLDAFLKDKSGRNEVSFSWVVTSRCGNCINTGEPNYYNLWMPLPGGGGFYACAGCHP